MGVASEHARGITGAFSFAQRCVHACTRWDAQRKAGRGSVYRKQDAATMHTDEGTDSPLRPARAQSKISPFEDPRSTKRSELQTDLPFNRRDVGIICLPVSVWSR